MVQSRCRADMRAAVEPRAERKDTAFARRTASGDHCREATVRLRQAQFRDFLEHKFLSSARRKPGAIRATKSTKWRRSIRSATRRTNERAPGAICDHRRVEQWPTPT